MRTEYKFLLSTSGYERLRERCRFMFNPDPHGQSEGAYPVFSAYYDRADLHYLYQKINGEFDHIKVRLRVYSPDLERGQKAFLEAKIKENSSQNKIRIPLDYHPGLLNPGTWYSLQSPEMDKMLRHCHDLYHVCNVYYERQAWHFRPTAALDIRINFDTNLAVLPPTQMRINPTALEAWRVMPADNIICEIKVPGTSIPRFLRKELRLVGADQVRISKYAEGMLTRACRSSSEGVFL